MDFSDWTRGEILDSIEGVKETLESYEGGNLTDDEKKNYEKMLKDLQALEAELKKRDVPQHWEAPKPKNMSFAELEEELHEISYDRKMFCRKRRGTTWSKEDEEEYEYMNAWAAEIFNEMKRRSGMV